MDQFKKVKSGKVSELISQQIKSAILNGRMKAGDKLPPERELVDQFQASRNSVREAINTLETSGLLIIKHGSGVFVAEVNSRPMSEPLYSFLRMKKTTLNELTEARIILEPNIARIACERMTPEDLLKLEHNIEETSQTMKSKSPALVSAKNIEFHSLIAEATHNAVISLTMKTLYDVVKEMTIEITDDLTKRKRISSRATDYHKKLLKAFREKNPQMTHELMLKHVRVIQQRFNQIIADRTKEGINKFQKRKE